MLNLSVSIFQVTVVRVALVFATLLFLTTVVDAQGVGAGRGPLGGGGRHTIKGRVYGPNGRPVEAGVKIRLESDSVGSTSTSTDPDGAFIFNNLAAGNYAVVIEADANHDAFREPVTIAGSFGSGRDTGPQSAIVNISLKARGAAAALAKVPKPARESYSKGMEAVSKNEHKKAAELFEAAIALHPDFPQALTELGLTYMRLDQMDKARQTYEALLKLKPADAGAHLNLGIALFNLSNALATEKKTEEAKEKLVSSETHLRESLKLNGTGPSAHYYLGLILIRTRKYAEAQKEIELAIANGGENLALAHKYLGGLYMSAKKNKEAADELEKYLQLDPKARDAEQIRGTIKDLRSKQ